MTLTTVAERRGCEEKTKRCTCVNVTKDKFYLTLPPQNILKVTKLFFSDIGTRKYVEDEKTTFCHLPCNVFLDVNFSKNVIVTRAFYKQNWGYVE